MASCGHECDHSRRAGQDLRRRKSEVRRSTDPTWRSRKAASSACWVQRRRQDDHRPHPRDAAQARRGRATVGGLDVVRQAQQLRPMIGLCRQYAAVDENLTATREPVDVRRLYQLLERGVPEARRELLEQFDLPTPETASSRPTRAACAAGSTSASALIGRPRLLFLDEPTTGLDPRSRLGMWDVIRDAGPGGHDAAAHHAVPRGSRRAGRHRSRSSTTGRSSRGGTADELKAQVGGERIEVIVATSGEDIPRRSSCSASTIAEPEVSVDEHIRTPDHPDERWRQRTRARSSVSSTRRTSRSTTSAVRRPTLDDVFLALTGHAAEDADERPQASAAWRRPAQRLSMTRTAHPSPTAASVRRSGRSWSSRGATSSASRASRSSRSSR